MMALEGQFIMLITYNNLTDHVAGKSNNIVNANNLLLSS